VRQIFRNNNPAIFDGEWNTIDVRERPQLRGVTETYQQRDHEKHGDEQ
jgi:hypothetical protein